MAYISAKGRTSSSVLRRFNTISQDDDYGYEGENQENTFEGFMCNKLSNYLKDLHQFRNNVLGLTKALTLDFPMVKKRSPRPMSTMKFAPLKRKEPSLVRIIRKKASNSPQKISHTQKEQGQIRKSKTWMKLNYIRIPSPKLADKQQNLNLTHTRLNKVLPNIFHKKNPLIKKSPYLFIPKNIRTIVIGIRKRGPIKSRGEPLVTAKAFSLLAN